MKYIKQISILLIILASGLVSAQVQFVAKVSKSKLGINERLRIDFVMNQDGDNFSPPSFSGFNLVGGPNQSVKNVYSNGVRSYKKTYSYFLSPKKRGLITIDQASITINKQVYKTTPIKVEITAAIDNPKNPNDPNYIASENIHLVAELSKTNPYLNEAITVVYKLYVSPSIAVDDIKELDIPRYNDFWSQNISTKDLKVQNGKYNGEDYRYVIYRKAVLYPQKTGKLNIEPLALDLAMRVPTNRRDIFGSKLMTRVNKTISAGNKSINVKALPEKGKPADFGGAVGDFSFNVFTSKRVLDATESLQLKVEVKGKGNLKLFKLPKISLPSSLEVYEPEHNEKVQTNLSGMRGSISDNYTVVPQYKGKYPIPRVSFSYFDVKTKSYKRLSSAEIIIEVSNGPLNNVQSSDNNSMSSGKQSVVLNSDQFAFIKSQPNLKAIDTSYFFRTKLFWSLLLMPFLAIPIVIFIRKSKVNRDADVYGNRIRKADKLARKYLSSAKKSLGTKEEFYIALEKALHNYLKAKLRIETQDLSKDKITSLLIKKQVDSDTIKKFIDILESCELARYTPMDIITMQEDYKKSAKTISLIDKQAR